MRIAPSLLVLVAVIVVASLGLAGAKAANALRAQPTTVGVVDLSKVFENLREQQQVKANLLQKQDQLKATLEDKRKGISTMQGDLDLLQPGSPAHQAKQAELDRGVIDVQVWSEFEARRLRMEEQLQIEGLVRKVNATIERVAKEQGLNVVLYKNQTVNLRGGENQNTQIQVRMVAYNDASIEVTDQLIQRMNNEFQSGAQ